MIKKNILKKLETLNDAGKIKFSFDIIVHCMQNLPDLEDINLEIIEDDTNQIVSMLKYIYSSHEDNLSKSKLDKLNKIANLKREIKKQNAEITRLENEIKLENSTKTERKQIIESLEIIKNLATENFEFNLKELINKFEVLKELSDSITELATSQEICERDLEDFENELNVFLENKQKIENELRGKINEI